MRDLERMAISGMRPAWKDVNPATMEAVSEAFIEVVGHERDVILARYS